ncbi:MAG: hypothetical protein IBX56_19995 [Methylomicrobium sp.]|nr:hypothetical protein [Methylomicrobium sp.]
MTIRNYSVRFFDDHKGHDNAQYLGSGQSGRVAQFDFYLAVNDQDVEKSIVIVRYGNEPHQYLAEHFDLVLEKDYGYNVLSYAKKLYLRRAKERLKQRRVV